MMLPRGGGGGAVMGGDTCSHGHWVSFSLYPLYWTLGTASVTLSRELQSVALLIFTIVNISKVNIA